MSDVRRGSTPVEAVCFCPHSPCCCEVAADGECCQDCEDECWGREDDDE